VLKELKVAKVLVFDVIAVIGWGGIDDSLIQVVRSCQHCAAPFDCVR